MMEADAEVRAAQAAAPATAAVVDAAVDRDEDGLLAGAYVVVDRDEANDDDANNEAEDEAAQAETGDNDDGDDDDDDDKDELAAADDDDQDEPAADQDGQAASVRRRLSSVDSADPDAELPGDNDCAGGADQEPRACQPAVEAAPTEEELAQQSTRLMMVLTAAGCLFLAGVLFVAPRVLPFDTKAEEAEVRHACGGLALLFATVSALVLAAASSVPLEPPLIVACDGNA